MKRELVLILFLLLISPCFACVTNAVEVVTNNSVEIAQIYHLFEGEYSIYENNSLYFYAHNDTSMHIKMTGERIVFHSLNESTDWERIIEEELYYLKNTGAIGLSEEEIIFISMNGCCGVYKDGEFTTPRGCTETFTVPQVNTSLTWIPVILSILPGIIILVYLARKDLKKYLIFLLGGAGWLIAYLLREPILVIISEYELLTAIVIASVLAGVFEEIIRYVILRSFKKARENPLLLGLGWGVTEAVLIYAVYISYLLLMNQPITFMNALPGAFERIVTIILHTALTMIVFKALKKPVYLLLAGFLHFFINTIAVVSVNIYSLNVWLVELIVLIITALTVTIAYSLNKEETSHVKKTERKNRKRVGRGRRR